MVVSCGQQNGHKDSDAIETAHEVSRCWGDQRMEINASLITLKKRRELREAQFHINVLEGAYAGWRNRTRQIFTRQRELLSKYTADVAGKSRTVGLTEAFAKTLLNIARILDKRRIQNSYCVMFQTWQNITVIQGYIAE